MWGNFDTAFPEVEVDFLWKHAFAREEVLAMQKFIYSIFNSHAHDNRTHVMAQKIKKEIVRLYPNYSWSVRAIHPILDFPLPYVKFMAFRISCYLDIGIFGQDRC